MFRCSSPANKLISVTFLGEFSFGCLPFSFSKQSVLGYGVRERVTFPKLPVSRTGRLLCWTDPGPRPHVRDSARGAPSVSPFLIPTFRAAHLCAGRARTHCCVLCAALPSCLSARRPPPGTPPAPNSVFCQPAFRHGEGSALCILLTVVSCFLYEGTQWVLRICHIKTGTNAAPPQSQSSSIRRKCLGSTSGMAVTLSCLESQRFVPSCFIP